MTKNSEFLTGYAAGRDAVKDKFGPHILVIVAMGFIIGGIVLRWLVARYSLPQSEGFMVSLVAVLVFGLLAGFVVSHASHGKTRGHP